MKAIWIRERLISFRSVARSIIDGIARLLGEMLRERFGVG